VFIALTVVLGVGVVAEKPELIAGLKHAGVLSMREEELRALIKAAVIRVCKWRGQDAGSDHCGSCCV